MLRKPYFQSSENPIQADRLPLIRTELELPATAPDAELPVVGTICLTAPVATVAAIAIHSLRISLEQGLPIYVTIIVVLAFVAVAIEGVLSRRGWLALRERLPWFILGGFTWLCVQFEMPIFVQAALAATAIGYLSFSFGEHWACFSTASPLERVQAKELRKCYRKFLAAMACLPLLIVCVSALLGSIELALLGLPVLAAIVVAETFLYSPESRTIVQVFSAWQSWCHYQTSNTPLPGVFLSPSGNHFDRMLLVTVTLFAVALPFTHSLTSNLWLPAPGAVESMPTNGPSLDWIDFSRLIMAAAVQVAIVIATPLLLVLLLPSIASLSVIVDASRFRQPQVTHENWSTLTNDLRNSSDPIERESIYIGRNVHDGSPLLVPRSVFSEHAHFLGDSGSGKTSLGLAPLIEQLAAGPPCSIVLLDLKADSLELYATLAAAAEKQRIASGEAVPLKHFTTEPGLSTFGFNPFRQPFLQDLDLYSKTDILCGALGLSYGSDYGESYYSSANAAVLFETLKRNPAIQSLREAAEQIRYLLAHASRKELDPSTRDAGGHVLMVLERLGSLDALNVTPEAGYADQVVEHAIDLSQLFLEPQMLYFHLPSTLAPSTSAEIGRLVVSSLLVTAKRTERRHPVYLIVDEFQRMVAKNLEMILQLARSMGVAVILANQTMQDLKSSRSNLIPAIEGNCRYRQWFSVSLNEDREQIQKGSGHTVETLMSESVSTHHNGSVTTAQSQHQTILPRLNANDILLCSDHPNHSVVRISRGAGYAQLGGMSCLVESTYHISADEYNSRRKFAWSADLDGSFVPGKDTKKPMKATATRGPVLTTEIIGADSSTTRPRTSRMPTTPKKSLKT